MKILKNLPSWLSSRWSVASDGLFLPGRLQLAITAVIHNCQSAALSKTAASHSKIYQPHWSKELQVVIKYFSHNVKNSHWLPIAPKSMHFPSYSWQWGGGAARVICAIIMPFYFTVHTGKAVCYMSQHSCQSQLTAAAVRTCCHLRIISNICCYSRWNPLQYAC